MIKNQEESSVKVLENWYKRIDRGVITEYVFLLNDQEIHTEIFRDQPSRCDCPQSHLYCQHRKLAVQLESNYQAQHGQDQPDSCDSCGSLARRWRGIALCSRCQ